MEEKSAPVILVVDDDPAVRNMIRAMLVYAKYLVLDACNGEEALKLSDKYSNAIDLVVTDVEMPKMGGLEMIPKMKEKRPQVKFLVISGKDSGKMRQASIKEDFLRKPLRMSAFLGKVREILARPDSGPEAEK